jgi:hypothetical protein
MQHYPQGAADTFLGAGHASQGRGARAQGARERLLVTLRTSLVAAPASLDARRAA